jgi:hypothetical protein
VLSQSRFFRTFKDAGRVAYDIMGGLCCEEEAIEDG